MANSTKKPLSIPPISGLLSQTFFKDLEKSRRLLDSQVEQEKEKSPVEQQQEMNAMRERATQQLEESAGNIKLPSNDF